MRSKMRAVYAYRLRQGWRDFLRGVKFLRAGQVPTRRMNEMEFAEWND